jgi:hypothetical protein
LFAQNIYHQQAVTASAISETQVFQKAVYNISDIIATFRTIV